jgi:diaminopimelate decarboxylase
MQSDISREQLLDIASNFGTPVYVYNAEKITQQYQRLLSSFSNVDARFFYAAKALTNINILSHINSIGCNVDCSSINEAKLALRAGFPSSNILYTSSNIDFSEIQEAVSLGISINIDSLSNLEKFGKHYGGSYPVGVRLRPNIMAGGNLKISTGHDRSKFGVPVEQLDELKSIVASTGLNIRTLHLHTGSEIKDVEVFIKGVQVLLNLTREFDSVEVIDMGGGFKVPYKPEEVGTDMELLGKELSQAMDAFEKETGRHLQVWFEPGKFLVSECGCFVTTVTVLKQTPTIQFAGINSGLNQLIRPMFYGSYHQIENISNPSGVLHAYTVVGNICETDTFAEDRMIAEIREGDHLVFKNAGAYGFEMASQYNSRFRPAEVLVKDGKAMLIRRREELEDLLSTQIIL